VTSPLTPLRIALFDAGLVGASGSAASLKQSLTDSGIAAHVVAFHAVTSDIDFSGFDSVFLRGLQSPASADLLLQAADESIRAALRLSGTPYQVIYGSDDESLGQLIRTLENLDTAPPITAVQSNQKTHSTDVTVPWIWLCDKCSDPQCEHRLLTDLLEQRQTRISV
jgi:hypothetical protein